jgi:NAD(P)-dependent dehydrogenase (short-subunit alcohol dehydrogenase family)
LARDSIRTFGRIDVLVNNAGIGLLSAFEVTPEHVLREVFETNTFGVMNVCRAVIPHMHEQGHGTIINVTSSARIAPMPLVAIYGASKCAVEGFTESLSYLQRMQNYPTDYSTEQDIVEAVFAAATDRGDQLRYPAGPDTKLLASLRWTTSEER